MMLQIEHIYKSFGGQPVLEDMSLTVGRGEIVGLLGSNGAGKTTLLRIVCRILEADGGTVTFDGHAMTQRDLDRIGYLPEERGLYRHQHAGSQAVYLAMLKGMGRKEATESVRRWFDKMGIASWWNRPVGRLSKGMQQRLQLLVTLAHDPDLVILDEPFSGFDAAGADMLKEVILGLKAEGKAILLTTHNLAAATELCDKTYTL